MAGVGALGGCRERAILGSLQCSQQAGLVLWAWACCYPNCVLFGAIHLSRPSCLRGVLRKSDAITNVRWVSLVSSSPSLRGRTCALCSPESLPLCHVGHRHTHPDIRVGNTGRGEKSKRDPNTRVCIYHVSKEAQWLFT